MSDWKEELAVAEAKAEQFQAAEAVAEQKFYAVKEAVGSRDEAVKTPEFGEWMEARRATDAAWGAWSQVMDAKAGS